MEKLVGNRVFTETLNKTTFKKPLKESEGSDKEIKAKALVKDYYDNKFDLETLHNKLEKVFGNKKDAFNWFAENDKKVKNEGLKLSKPKHNVAKKINEEESGNVEEYKAKLISALKKLHDEFNNVVEVLYEDDKYGIDSNEFIVDEYPFDKSFDDLAYEVGNWVESVEDVCEGSKKSSF